MATPARPLKGKLTTLAQFAKRLGLTKEGASQAIKREEIETETPCSRCGSSITLLRQSDAKRLEKQRAGR